MKELDALIAERDDLNKKIEELTKVEKNKAITEIRGLISRFNLKPDDLFEPAQAPASAKSSTSPRYRDPQTGATWSGRGRCPSWLQGKKQGQLLN